MEDIEIRQVLLRIGISYHTKGYQFILEAIKILRKQQIHTNIIDIYEMISNKTNSTKNYVERGIRSAITTAYKRGTVLSKIYNRKPVNAAFLYDMVFNFDIFLNEINKGEVK